MEIELDHIIPYNISMRTFDSDVWDQSIVFESGSIVELTAPSARGKTTLISILYGLRFDYSGEIRIDGRNMRSFSARDWSHIRTKSFSIVFQDLRLFDERTSLENILVKAFLSGIDDESSIRAMAERTGIGDSLDKPVGKLSWGEKQRIALLRALVQPSDFIFLDEPFSHLDADATKKCAELVLEHHHKLDSGIICSTLDPSRVFPFTKRIRV
jgi:ABC-type lipoprotein export system ATPase subunit